MPKFSITDLLNSPVVKQSNEDIEIEDRFSIKMISIYDITESRHNFYRTDDIEELATSIETFGLQQNLLVKEIGGKYELIAGHRRRLACLKLVNEGKKQFERVPCKVEQTGEDIIQKLLLIYTNSTTRQLSEFEKIEQMKQLKELLGEYKKTHKLEGRIRDYIAQTLSVSSTQVARMECIQNNLSDEFKEVLKKEKLNISTAYELSGLDHQQQQAAFEEFSESNHLSIHDVKKMKDIKNNSLNECSICKKEDSKISLKTKSRKNIFGLYQSDNVTDWICTDGYKKDLFQFKYCPYCGKRL